MKLQRCVLTLLLGASAWTSGLAHAASPAPISRPPAVAAGPSWWDSVQDMFSSDALVVGKQVLLSLLLFLAGWLVAKIIAFAVYRGLCRTSLDNQLAAKLHLGVLSDGRPQTPGKPAQPNALERGIANVDLAGKATVGRVKAGEIAHAFEVGRLVDGDHLEIVRCRRFEQGAQETATDPAVAVDGKTQGHVGAVVFQVVYFACSTTSSGLYSR